MALNKDGEYLAISWDTDNDFEYVRGHVTMSEAYLALHDEGVDGCFDGVEHVWARWVPRGAWYNNTWCPADGQRIYPAEQPAPGAFKVTKVFYLEPPY